MINNKKGFGKGKVRVCFAGFWITLNPKITATFMVSGNVAKWSFDNVPEGVKKWLKFN